MKKLTKAETVRKNLREIVRISSCLNDGTGTEFQRISEIHELAKEALRAAGINYSAGYFQQEPRRG